MRAPGRTVMNCNPNCNPGGLLINPKLDNSPAVGAPCRSASAAAVQGANAIPLGVRPMLIGLPGVPAVVAIGMTLPTGQPAQFPAM
jgi:hypothetical protein